MNTVLVVEDEALVRMMIVETLRDAGFSVLEAGDSAEAQDILGRNQVDLLVTDLNIPGIDGLALIAHARERQPKLPAVLMTGAAPQNGANEPGIEVIGKPFSPEDLPDMMRRLLA
jgi:CheY-like chemotaxis protein